MIYSKGKWTSSCTNKSLKAKKDPIIKEIEQEFPVSILWVMGFVPIV
jgi:hypothetical protein